MKTFSSEGSKSQICCVYTFLVESYDTHLEIIIPLFLQLVYASP